MVCGLVFAALMRPRTHDADAKQRAAIGPLAAEHLEEARRAATNGPVPADPEVRAAAARLTALHLAGSRGDRGWTAYLAVVTALSARCALTGTPWWWLTAVGIAAALGHTMWPPGHLERRLALLQARDCAPPAVAVEPARSPAGVS